MTPSQDEQVLSIYKSNYPSDYAKYTKMYPPIDTVTNISVHKTVTSHEVSDNHMSFNNNGRSNNVNGGSVGKNSVVFLI